MTRRLFQFSLASMFCCLLLATGVSAQDFKKSYRINPGDPIRVSSASGDVIITGHTDGDSIIVTAYKEGRDRDMVEIEDLSTASSVEVRSLYPKNCNCNASIRFEIQVPRSVGYKYDRISSASGDIKISDITGDLRVSAASGNVYVKGVKGNVSASTASGDLGVHEVEGTVNARTASGYLNVEITRLEGAGKMEFRAASGDINVRVPGNLDAEVSMSTMSGTLETDFPIQIQEKERGPGRRAQGRVGSGAGSLTISAASGNVKLKRL